LNPRDFLTSAAIGLVLVVGGLAIADSVRSCERSGREVAPTRTTATTTSENSGPGPRPDAPSGWPEGALDGVLTFVDAESCLVRAIGLSGGRERPLTEYQTDCGGFWAPRIGARIAYGTFFAALRTRGFRIADLGHGDRDYGEYALPDGEVLWSFDAQRLAWCDTLRTGFEREFLDGVRPLPFCPIAYTPEGDLARAVGNRLVVGTRTLLITSGPMSFAQFGLDGSIAVLVSGSTLERYVEGEPTVSTELPTGRLDLPVLSPDTCTAAVPLDSGISLFSLCGSGSSRGFAGQAAAWSPDGQWLAVTEPDAIVFHRLEGPDQEFRWPASAAHLAWRAG
jgi:hypothetical protein